MTTRAEVAAATADDGEATTGQRFAAEALGTGLLLFLGFGAALVGATVPEQAAAWGLALAGVTTFLGHVSSAHANPAVSVGSVVAGRTNAGDLGTHVAAQVVGGLVGGGLLVVITLGLDDFGDHYLPASGYGASSGSGVQAQVTAPGTHAWAIVLLELVLSFFFVLVFLAATDPARRPTDDPRRDQPGLAPVAIGLALALVYLIGLRLDGGGVNPAKSLVGAVFQGGDGLAHLWLFVLVPPVGGALAGLVQPRLNGGRGRTTSATVEPVAAPAPIIENGWQWDPQAQQWIPAPQPGPPAA